MDLEALYNEAVNWQTNAKTILGINDFGTIIKPNVISANIYKDYIEQQISCYKLMANSQTEDPVQLEQHLMQFYKDWNIKP